MTRVPIYLLVDLCTISVPFLCSFHTKIRFDKTFYALWPALTLSAAPLLIWDYYFTRWGVWGFNKQYLLGPALGGIPIEEILFFFCIPYACVFTYFCLGKFGNLASTPVRPALLYALAGACSLLAIASVGSKYTSSVSLLAAALLLLHAALIRPLWMSRFIVAYSALLLPFLIVNGILTGAGLDEPIVWYNNAENLGIRVGTIPVEDFLYALLLILLPITFYEKLLALRPERS
jgi:lycopene cyclase domain-containing protein